MFADLWHPDTSTRRGRYYWKVKLPGEAEVKARPLVPTGGRYATKDKGVAVCVAEHIWTNAVFHTDANMNVPGNGSMASLVRADLGHADAYYRHADGTPTKWNRFAMLFYSGFPIRVGNDNWRW